MLSATPLEPENEGSRLGFELLLRCARPRLNAQEKEQIRTLLAERIDWRTLLQKARQHGVMPLLWWHLQSIYPHRIPQPALDELHNYFRANARRNLLLIREITRLVGLLQTNEIPMIFFKGPLLGAMAYGSLSLRASVDLDILIHQSDFPKVKCLLSTEGYLPPRSWSRFQGSSFVLYATECHFLQAENGIELDVHWQILPRTISHAFNSDQVWQRIRYFRLGNTQVPTLSREDLLLFLCVHGSKHFWERLSWICDIASIIRVSAALDWSEILRRAELQGSSRMLYLGLALARDLMAAELHPEVLSRIRADSEVDALAAQVRELLATDRLTKLRRRERIAFHLLVTKRFADKIRYLSRWVIRPTIGDLLLLNLPRALFFLYYVIRPFRLLAKCGNLAVNLFRAELRFRRVSE